jgi:hypothetical protein
MYRTRSTELLIRASFVLALLLLVAVVIAGYFSLARGSSLDGFILGASVLALVLLMLSLLALRRDFAGRGRAEAQLDRFFDILI